MAPEHPLRPTLLGDVPRDAWPSGDEASGEPWDGFVRARRHLAAGDQDLAAREWFAVAHTPGIEARHTLQAWHFLRSINIHPDESIAGEVLGVVAEVAVGDGHDLLAAYVDGSVRYLNHAGGATILDPPDAATAGPADEEVRQAVATWLGEAQRVADATGPLEPGPWPDLPAGHTRFAMLTRGGPHLGQGPDEVLRGEPMAQGLFGAATDLLVLVVSCTLPPA